MYNKKNMKEIIELLKPYMTKELIFWCYLLRKDWVYDRLVYTDIEWEWKAEFVSYINYELQNYTFDDDVYFYTEWNKPNNISRNTFEIIGNLDQSALFRYIYWVSSLSKEDIDIYVDFIVIKELENKFHQIPNKWFELFSEEELSELYRTLKRIALIKDPR